MFAVDRSSRNFIDGFEKDKSVDRMENIEPFVVRNDIGDDLGEFDGLVTMAHKKIMSKPDSQKGGSNPKTFAQ